MMAGLATPAWRCWSIQPVSEKFHPSFGARSRSYVYMVDASAVQEFLLDPHKGALLIDDFVHRVDGMLREIESKSLDYFAVSYGKLKTETTLCCLSRARAKLLERRGNLENVNGDRVIVVELCGDRFLRRMVRILVAIAFQTALTGNHEKSTTLTVSEIIHNRDRRLSAKAAPPCGLVFLGSDIEDVA